MRGYLIIFSIIVTILTGCSQKELTKDLSEVNSIEDFVGLNIGVAAGSSYDLALSEMEGVHLTYIGINEMVMAVANGMVDFAIMDQLMAQMAHLEKFGVGIKFDKILESYSCVGMRYDEQELMDKFNSFLSEIKSGDEYESMMSSWLNNPDSMAIDLTANRPYIQGKDPVIVGVTDNIYPHIFNVDNTFVGIEIDIMNRFSRAYNIPIEYVAYEFMSLVPALNCGKIDIILSHMRRTEERAKLVLFSDPYQGGSGAALYKLGSDELAGLKNDSLFSRIKSVIYDNIVQDGFWKLLLDGLDATLQISLLSIIMSILVGIALCAARLSKKSFISNAVNWFNVFIKGVPVLVILLIFCYVVFGSVNVNPILMAVSCLSVYNGVFFCEDFYVGMKSVDKGQWESGASLGLSKIEVFKHIVLPQAFRQFLPVFKGDVINLVQMTSIVGYVSIVDITMACDTIGAKTLNAFFTLILASLIYIIISFSISKVFEKLKETFAVK